jgi:hypothetical protein
LSSHVTLVRPAPRLRRVAPGVQMLLTIDTADTQEPVRVSQAPVASLPFVQLGNDTTTADDPRFELFQALFALIEDDRPVSAAPAPSQLAAATFGVVSDIDDFTRP